MGQMTPRGDAALAAMKVAAVALGANAEGNWASYKGRPVESAEALKSASSDAGLVRALYARCEAVQSCDRQQLVARTLEVLETLRETIAAAQAADVETPAAPAAEVAPAAPAEEPVQLAPTTEVEAPEAAPVEAAPEPQPEPEPPAHAGLPKADRRVVRRRVRQAKRVSKAAAAEARRAVRDIRAAMHG